MTRFNQYFTGYKGRNLADTAPQQARFVQQFDGRRLHRTKRVRLINSYAPA